MPSFYDDNFGYYEIESEEDIEFYFEMQSRSVEKVCQGCKKRVKMAPQYAICNACAERLERGLDLE